MNGNISSNSDQYANDNETLPENEIKIKKDLVSMKGWFTENKGQIENSEVQYDYSASDRAVGFIESGYLVKLTNNENVTSIVQITFEGANSIAPEGLDELTHRSNFISGNNSLNWKTDVFNYQKVVYKNLYDGIDLVFYTVEEGLKYDFILTPGSHPDDIRMNYDGTLETSIDDMGNLIISTSAGFWVEEKPYCYQVVEGKIGEVESKYLLNGFNVSYEIESYDEEITLIIDPLVYSTFFGDTAFDQTNSICIDSENNAYITGFTHSTDFPTTPGCYDDTYNGEQDVFIFKLNADGSSLIFSTFVGGSSADAGYACSIDSQGNTYVTGTTMSIDFPTTSGSYDRLFNGRGLVAYGDAFVFKLNSDGSNLIYSTYLGGIDGDGGHSITVDLNNCAYVTGTTTSPDFPTTLGCYDLVYNGLSEAFVTKLNGDGSDLVYSTFIGGSSFDEGYGIISDEENNIYVTGETSSLNFPTSSGCYDDTHNGEIDGFVFKLNPDGSELDYSTYVGGSAREHFWGLSLDSTHNLYVTGSTESLDFPTTTGCYDDSISGDSYDAFVLKLNPDGSNLIISTYIGGNETDDGYSIAVDVNNYIYVAGRTRSLDFPTTSGCYDNTHNNGTFDVIIFKMNPLGSNLMYSTYVGGEGPDYGKTIKLDSDNNAYVAGWTSSMDFPTTPGCYDESNNGNREIFLCQLRFLP